MKQEEKRDGFTFIEIVVSIALLLVLAFIIDVLLINRLLQTRTSYEALAHQIAQEELEVLRSYPYTLLTTTTDGFFKGILFHKGTIEVTSSTDAFNGSHFVDITSASSTAPTTGHFVLPKNSYKDVTIEAQLRIFSDSPITHGMGILFRALDESNGYLVRISSSNDVYLDVIQDGVVTNLISQLYTVVTDTWYDFKITLSENSIDLDINSLPIFNTTDTTFTEGYAAIVATDEAHIGIDNVTITESSAINWDFDSYTLGDISEEWQRPGLSDLPSSTAKLNISNYLGSDKLKEASATVEWVTNNTNFSITESTLIGQ